MKISTYIFLLAIVFVFFFTSENSLSTELDHNKPKLINKESNPKQIYLIEATRAINSNWSYNLKELDKNQELMTMVAVKVLQSGEILDIWFEKRSGNLAFDESVNKAIQLSNPLPPFPEGMKNESITFGLRFTPKP